MLARRDLYCIIRNTGTGWAVLHDNDHLPIGVVDVVQFADRIELNYDFTAAKVHSFGVMPDETYAALDQYTAGASVGFSKAAIYFGKPGINGKVNPANIKNPSGNFFIAGFFSVDVETQGS